MATIVKESTDKINMHVKIDISFTCDNANRILNKNIMEDKECEPLRQMILGLYKPARDYYAELLYGNGEEHCVGKLFRKFNREKEMIMDIVRLLKMNQNLNNK